MEQQQATQTPIDVLKVCAWCGLVLAGSKASPNPLVSHGICAGCSERFMGEAFDRR